ncbi:MAG: SusC/RagA family TonB-linked outer membrane protein [Paludibacteraceae bacterium]
MRKLKLFFTCLLMASISLVNAQTKTASGTVISSDDGQPVVGASVIVKGTSQGVTTNLDGKYTISVPTSIQTLVISYVGMKTIEVAANQNVDVVLNPSDRELSEVVVTAMGITRDKKALGYSATSVNGDAISEKRTSDIMTSLAGKVAGVQISSTSSDPGTSNSVVIRGFSSLSGSNQPLYVIDGVPMNNSAVYSSDGLNNGFDFGNGANAVNPDDVANMTILKGAAATALYGNRAAAGVILITTKSGKANKKGLGVEYNGGLQFSSVLRLPEMQNEFGMGWNGNKTLIENGSWGPKFDGSLQLFGNIYNNSQKLKSYVALPNNIKDFFDTGLRYSNSLSFNGATEKSDYFVSFSQISDNGILPTNADTYDKYTFSVRGSHKIEALTISTSINYETQKNKFAQTGQGLSMVNSIYQMPRDISLIGLKDLSDPFNTPGYYYTPYGVTNPYWVLENYKNEYNASKIYGKFQLDYDFLKYFKATYRIGLDETSGEQDYGVPNMQALFAGTPNASAFEGEEGSVSVATSKRREINQDILLTYNQTVSDFTINGLAGINLNERKYSSLSAGIRGLDIPTWFNLSNTATTPVVSTYNSLRRLFGVFGQVDLSWKSMVYLTATARNDWSSTLPKNHNSFFYPGITGSFIFTEILPKNNVLTFGKIRAAYGQTGNDANVYMIDPVFAQASANSSGWGGVSFPLNGINAFSQGNVLGNKNLSPEITTEYEFGTNLAFFNGRISIDAAYYNRNSDKQIFSLNMDPASGYTAQNINLGKIQNKGVELLVNLKPVETKDFSWDLSWNFTKNNSKVISLPEELGGIATIYGLTGDVTMYAIVGQPLGTFKAQVAKRDPNGNIVVNRSTGLPVAADEFAICGNMNYDYEMGISNTLKYKSLSLGFDFDIRQGGVMFSRTKDINYFTGNAIQTIYNDRNPFIVPNSVNAVTASDGTVSYVENTTPVAVSDILTYWDNGGIDMGSKNLIDRSYIKLRSLIIGWDLPNSWFAKTPFQGVKLSAYGNNLFVWTPASNTFIDPEVTSFGNDLSGKYGEFSANPSTRRFGCNLMIKF